MASPYAMEQTNKDLYNELGMRYDDKPVLIVEGPQDFDLLQRVLDPDNFCIMTAHGSKRVKSLRQEIEDRSDSRKQDLGYPVVFLLDADYSDLSSVSESYVPGSRTVVTKYNDLDAEIFFDLRPVDEYVSRELDVSFVRRVGLQQGFRSANQKIEEIFESLLARIESHENEEYIPFGGKADIFKYIEYSSLKLNEGAIRDLWFAGARCISDAASLRKPRRFRMNGHLLFRVSARAIELFYGHKCGKDFARQVRRMYSNDDIANLDSVRNILTEFRMQGVSVREAVKAAA